MLNLLNKLDVWRKPDILQQVLAVCEADLRGRDGWENAPYPQKNIIEQAYVAAKQVNIQEIIKAGFKGKAIQDELNIRRALAIKQLRV